LAPAARLKVTGAEPVRYLDETSGCGAGLREMAQIDALGLTPLKIGQMEEKGASAIFKPGAPPKTIKLDSSLSQSNKAHWRSLRQPRCPENTEMLPPQLRCK